MYQSSAASCDEAANQFPQSPRERPELWKWYSRFSVSRVAIVHAPPIATSLANEVDGSVGIGGGAPAGIVPVSRPYSSARDEARLGTARPLGVGDDGRP